MTDIVERLRVVPIVVLDHHQVQAGAVIREMMVERAEAADEIERLRKALDDLDALYGIVGQERGKLLEALINGIFGE